MLDNVFYSTVQEEYLKYICDFTDLTTLSDRMTERDRISCEFVGKDYGWMRISFVSVEKVDGLQRKVMLVTQIVDEEKKSQIELLFQSNNDEMTGLNNRRAYEHDITQLGSGELPENLLFVAMDVNGLKNVNDSLGHAAGDELLLGASECMKKCFSSFGKIYRVGGDEFEAILNVAPDKHDDLKDDFQRTVDSWSGKLVDHVSISTGYVTLAEAGDMSLHDISVLADQRMYEAKNEYYKRTGQERRRTQG